jgi:hypothetical protein
MVTPLGQERGTNLNPSHRSGSETEELCSAYSIG